MIRRKTCGNSADDLVEDRVFLLTLNGPEGFAAGNSVSIKLSIDSFLPLICAKFIPFLIMKKEKRKIVKRPNKNESSIPSPHLFLTVVILLIG